MKTFKRLIIITLMAIICATCVAQSEYDEFDPVFELEFSYFTVKSNLLGDVHIIEWGCQYEINADHFDLEYSTDTYGWALFDQVDSGQLIYRINHSGFFSQFEYISYRIIAVGVDGDYTISKPICIYR